MASLGRKSQFGFALGADAVRYASVENEYLYNVANSSTGIRFANLPMIYRGDPNLDVTVSRRYSSTVDVVAGPSDKSDLSGVIRNKNWRPRNLILS